MDQAFTIKNLNKIMSDDREKGGDLEKVFIPQAFKVRGKLAKLRSRFFLTRYKFRKGKISEDFYKKRISKINSIKEKRREIHKKIINTELGRVSKLISAKDFRLNLQLNPISISGKATYSVGSTLEQILAVRFVQYILKTIYGIKMPSRDILISQIKSIVSDKVPKYLIRADIESFYESVDHEYLLEEIHESPVLSVLIKRILTRLLTDFQKITGSNFGVPRGIGVSAYLSEIYLSGIDVEIKKQDGLYYYSRYVDDMFMVYSPSRADIAKKYLTDLKKILAKKGLKVNNKTKTLDLLKGNSGNFEYLGYEFSFPNGTCELTLSKKKEKKYIDRIDKAFSDYLNKSTFMPNKAAAEILCRCKFLTGNIRLFSRKSNAFIGIYYSNKYITDKKQIVNMDVHLNKKISTIKNSALQKKLLKCSFVKGFEEKIFRNFDAEQISELAKGWRHV